MPRSPTRRSTPTSASTRRARCRAPPGRRTRVTYTGNNRTHMIRIPDAGRFELRLADGAANPYLLQAGDARRRPRRHRAPGAIPGKRLDINMYTEGHTVKERQAAAAQPPRRAPRARRQPGLPRARSATNSSPPISSSSTPSGTTTPATSPTGSGKRRWTASSCFSEKHESRDGAGGSSPAKRGRNRPRRISQL